MDKRAENQYVPDTVSAPGEGAIPAGKLKLVAAWIELHREELMADWELASQGETVFPIDPLR
ncbi:MAG: DUF4160 domain-containing protein [Deltaproteobacteria bacterium]|nr:DUF4160 domain-containing protein [Deltaproteobacteria bacterium]